MIYNNATNSPRTTLLLRVGIDRMGMAHFKKSYHRGEKLISSLLVQFWYI
jgi:hypothetical protein